MMARPARAPVLLATRSAGKLRELRPLFASLGVSLMDLDELGLPVDDDEEAIERFDTFEENALAKARYFFEASGGIATMADDSGLEVFALGGMPGVRSKRWAQDVSAQRGGEGSVGGVKSLGAVVDAGPNRTDVDAANNAVLIQAISAIDDPRARYVCAAAHVGLDGEVVRRGESEGTMITVPRGMGGFGYDPYFLSTELGRTFAEATREEKERVSHRGRAFRALLEAMARAD